MRIQDRDGVLTKIVLEVRYRNGFVYLDKCGRTINTIIQQNPEWMTKGVDPQNAGLVSIENRCSFNFNSAQYIFHLERPLGGEALGSSDLQSFYQQVQAVSTIVHDHLALKTFTRIGCRLWYFFEADSKEDAESWLLGLGAYKINSNLATVFGSRTSSASVSVLLEGADRGYRVSLNPVERQAQLDLGSEILSVRASSLSKEQNKVLLQQVQTRQRLKASPGHAAMIDVDVFLDDPVNPDCQDFVSQSVKHVQDKLPAALVRTTGENK